MKTDNSHKTAIRRNAPSAPTKWLHQNNLLFGRILDFGSGREDDYDYLRSIHFDVDKYDTHFSPKRPQGYFDTVICVYVLNVLKPDSRDIAYYDAISQLKQGGHCYFAVRRDIKQEGRRPASGTYQFNVTLDLPIIFKNKNYCIYEYTKQ